MVDKTITRKTPPSAVIAGCGYVGSALAERLSRCGGNVTTVRRSRRTGPGTRSLSADLLDLPGLRRSLAGEPVDTLVYAASPDERTDKGYENAYVIGLRNAMIACRPRRTLLVGSTGVLTCDDGRWVDESTPVVPSGFVACRLAEAEQLVRRAGGTTLRLGGIYGPGRERLIRMVEDGSALVPDSTVYTNRIHRDDAAGMLHHLMDHPHPEAVYFGCDRYAAPYEEVIRFIAGELGVDVPPVGPSSRRSNKRIQAARIVRSGYQFEYPTFREGYRQMIRDLVR